jgi:hypothetical protein
VAPHFRATASGKMDSGCRKISPAQDKENRTAQTARNDFIQHLQDVFQQQNSGSKNLSQARNSSPAQP